MCIPPSLSRCFLENYFFYRVTVRSTRCARISGTLIDMSKEKKNDLFILINPEKREFRARSKLFFPMQRVSISVTEFELATDNR